MTIGQVYEKLPEGKTSHCVSSDMSDCGIIIWIWLFCTFWSLHKTPIVSMISLYHYIVIKNDRYEIMLLQYSYLTPRAPTNSIRRMYNQYLTLLLFYWFQHVHPSTDLTSTANPRRAANLTMARGVRSQLNSSTKQTPKSPNPQDRKKTKQADTRKASNQNNPETNENDKQPIWTLVTSSTQQRRSHTPEETHLGKPH